MVLVLVPVAVMTGGVSLKVWLLLTLKVIAPAILAWFKAVIASVKLLKLPLVFVAMVLSMVNVPLRLVGSVGVA